MMSSPVTSSASCNCFVRDTTQVCETRGWRTVPRNKCFEVSNDRSLLIPMTLHPWGQQTALERHSICTGPVTFYVLYCCLRVLCSHFTNSYQLSLHQTRQAIQVKKDADEMGSYREIYSFISFVSLLFHWGTYFLMVLSVTCFHSLFLYLALYQASASRKAGTRP